MRASIAMQDLAGDIRDRAGAVLANPRDWALFLDIDGTLLRMAPTPDAVSVPAELPRCWPRWRTALMARLPLSRAGGWPKPTGCWHRSSSWPPACTAPSCARTRTGRSNAGRARARRRDPGNDDERQPASPTAFWSSRKAPALRSTTATRRQLNAPSSWRSRASSAFPPTTSCCGAVAKFWRPCRAASQRVRR